MNILLIGNGFDLAHNLPTQYRHFLEWMNEYTKIRDFREFWHEESIKPYFKELLDNDSKQSIKEELDIITDDNIWIEYFTKCRSYVKENWIDFENEISRIIKSMDMDMIRDNGNKYELFEHVYSLSNNFLQQKYSDNLYSNRSFIKQSNKDTQIGLTFGQIRDKLYFDLNKLIRGLEIYLTDYVANQACQLYSPDIKALDIEAVLSFNYTNTYERIYNPQKDMKYDFIHGVAKKENTITTNNMVLGIDEYLPKERKDKEVEFIMFKKYYQRIYKQTGCQYKEWTDEMECDMFFEKEMVKEGLYKQIPFDRIVNQNYLYIFGHSLDVTDKDVLRALILKDNVYTTIFYHEEINTDGKSDKGRIDLEQKIANLVKVIGQDELIKRTGGNTKTIEFRLQAGMVEVSAEA